MFARLAKNGISFEEQTRMHINEYADAGLRTLLLAYRELDEAEYNEFNAEFTEAKNSVSAEREEMVEEVAGKIEKDLILLGATAVEDKLQNGVSFGYRSHYDTHFICIFYGVLVLSFLVRHRIKSILLIELFSSFFLE